MIASNLVFNWARACAPSSLPDGAALYVGLGIPQGEVPAGVSSLSGLAAGSYSQAVIATATFGAAGASHSSLWRWAEANRDEEAGLASEIGTIAILGGAAVFRQAGGEEVALEPVKPSLSSKLSEAMRLEMSLSQAAAASARPVSEPIDIIKGIWETVFQPLQGRAQELTGGEGDIGKRFKTFANNIEEIKKDTAAGKTYSEPENVRYLWDTLLFVQELCGVLLRGIGLVTPHRLAGAYEGLTKDFAAVWRNALLSERASLEHYGIRVVESSEFNRPGTTFILEILKSAAKNNSDEPVNVGEGAGFRGIVTQLADGDGLPEAIIEMPAMVCAEGGALAGYLAEKPKVLRMIAGAVGIRVKRTPDLHDFAYAAAMKALAIIEGITPSNENVRQAIERAVRRAKSALDFHLIFLNRYIPNVNARKSKLAHVVMYVLDPITEELHTAFEERVGVMGATDILLKAFRDQGGGVVMTPKIGVPLTSIGDEAGIVFVRAPDKALSGYLSQKPGHVANVKLHALRFPDGSERKGNVVAVQ